MQASTHISGHVLTRVPCFILALAVTRSLSSHKCNVRCLQYGQNYLVSGSNDCTVKVGVPQHMPCGRATAYAQQVVQRHLGMCSDRHDT